MSVNKTTDVIERRVRGGNETGTGAGTRLSNIITLFAFCFAFQMAEIETNPAQL